ncbi:MAG: ABC transporter ATP-binding protein, partial [Methanobrevibacter sp.]|nr:ABC transporter ATP-binding protein [Methanobrevibacter sp.]
MNEDIKKEVAVSVKNISKSFKLPTESSSSLKTTIINYFKGIKGYKEQKILKDISFDVENGDFFGIVGRNGSGKSTLLKIISEIYVPEHGSIDINGRIVSFIELGVGFNPELTGKENVYLNGALLGFSTKEINNDMYEDIVNFSELHESMNQKLKNYSSGMQVRLAFAVAIQSKSDILVIDEVLAVGDESFQRKCNEYFEERKKTDKTTILVTHDMSAIRKYCNKAILIREGEIVVSGSPEDVASQYSIDNFQPFETTDTDEKNEENYLKFPLGLSELVPSFDIVLLSKQNLESGNDLICEIKYEITSSIPIILGLSIVLDGMAGSIVDSGDRDENGEFIVRSTAKGKYSYKWIFPTNDINKGKFTVLASLFQLKNGKLIRIAYTTEER